MAEQSSRRADLLTGACTYVLGQSLSAFSLRPLAAALGTSDRMLIYHFGSRDGLVRAVIGALGDELMNLLAELLPSGPTEPATVLTAVATAAGVPQAQPILRVWLELCGLAARGEEPYAQEVCRVTESWLAWLAPRLACEDAERAATATAVLAAVDGLILLRLAAGQDVTAAARVLAVRGP